MGRRQFWHFYFLGAPNIFRDLKIIPDFFRIILNFHIWQVGSTSHPLLGNFFKCSSVSTLGQFGQYWHLYFDPSLMSYEYSLPVPCPKLIIIEITGLKVPSSFLPRLVGFRVRMRVHRDVDEQPSISHLVPPQDVWGRGRGKFYCMRSISITMLNCLAS